MTDDGKIWKSIDAGIGWVDINVGPPTRQPIAYNFSVELSQGHFVVGPNYLMSWNLPPTFDDLGTPNPEIEIIIGDTLSFSQNSYVPFNANEDFILTDDTGGAIPNFVLNQTTQSFTWTTTVAGDYYYKSTNQPLPPNGPGAKITVHSAPTDISMSWSGIASDSTGVIWLATIYNGNIWKSINSGDTWVELLNSPPEEGNNLWVSINHDNSEWFAREHRGITWKSSDDGASWSTYWDLSANITELNDQNYNAVAVSSDGNIWKKEKWGEYWYKIPEWDYAPLPNQKWSSINATKEHFQREDNNGTVEVDVFTLTAENGDIWKSVNFRTLGYYSNRWSNNDMLRTGQFVDYWTKMPITTPETSLPEQILQDRTEKIGTFPSGSTLVGDNDVFKLEDGKLFLKEYTSHLTGNKTVTITKQVNPANIIPDVQGKGDIIFSSVFTKTLYLNQKPTITLNTSTATFRDDASSIWNANFQLGETLVAIVGDTDGLPQSNLITWTWRRNGTEVVVGGGNTYTLTIVDLGTIISATPTYTDNTGFQHSGVTSTVQETTGTDELGNQNGEIKSSAITIEGVPVVGETLTGRRHNNNKWQWFTKSGGGIAVEDQAGWGNNTYVIKPADAGKTIKVHRSVASDVAVSDIGGNYIESGYTLPIISKPPTITSTTNTGIYSVGDVDITIVATYDQPMTWASGAPRLELNISGRFALYYSGIGTNEITFKHTIVEGDEIDKLEVIGFTEIRGDTALSDIIYIHTFPSLSNTIEIARNERTKKGRKAGISKDYLGMLRTNTFSNSNVVRNTTGKGVINDSFISGDTLKSIIGNTVGEIRKRRSGAIKFIFSQDPLVKRISIPKEALALSANFPASNVIIVRPGEEIIPSTLIADSGIADSGFYVSLEDDEVIKIILNNIKIKFVRDDEGDQERYFVKQYVGDVDSDIDVDDITISIPEGNTNTGTFSINNTSGYLINGDSVTLDGRLFFINSIADGGFGNPAIVPVPAISLTNDNAVVTFKFDQPVFTNVGGTIPLVISDISLTLTGGIATLTDVPISSLIISSDNTTFEVGINYSPPGAFNGNELLTINPSSATAIYNAGGKAADESQSNNTILASEVTVVPVVPVAANNPSSIGDPYIMPIYGDIYKLPDLTASYRLYELGNIFINAKVDKATKEMQGRMLDFYRKLGGDEAQEMITNGYYYHKFFISSEGHTMMLDLTKNKIIVNEKDKIYFSLSIEKKNERQDLLKIGSYVEFSISWNTEKYGNMHITIDLYNNPQIDNGIKILSHIDDNSVGLLIKNYEPSTMEIDDVTTLRTGDIIKKLKNNPPLADSNVFEDNEVFEIFSSNN